MFDVRHCGLMATFRMQKLMTCDSLQKNVKHPDTFESHTLSLPKRQYESMVKSMKLPLSWIETSSCVGPVFWSATTMIDGKQYLRKCCTFFFCPISKIQELKLSAQKFSIAKAT